MIKTHHVVITGLIRFILPSAYALLRPLQYVLSSLFCPKWLRWPRIDHILASMAHVRHKRRIGPFFSRMNCRLIAFCLSPFYAVYTYTLFCFCPEVLAGA